MRRKHLVTVSSKQQHIPADCINKLIDFHNRKDTLDSHLATHSDLKEYICSVCGKLAHVRPPKNNADPALDPTPCKKRDVKNWPVRTWLA